MEGRSGDALEKQEPRIKDVGNNQSQRVINNGVPHKIWSVDWSIYNTTRCLPMVPWVAAFWFEHNTCVGCVFTFPYFQKPDDISK